MNEKQREELRERLREREDTVREMVEQLEVEKEKLDDARQKLKTLPRPLVWEPLKGRIGLLEGRVDSLMQDLAKARLALLEEREAQARAVYKGIAAKANKARQTEREMWRALRTFQNRGAKGTGAREGDAKRLAELLGAHEKAQALAAELQQAQDDAMHKLNVAEQQRQGLERELGALLK